MFHVLNSFISKCQYAFEEHINENKLIQGMFFWHYGSQHCTDNFDPFAIHSVVLFHL